MSLQKEHYFPCLEIRCIESIPVVYPDTNLDPCLDRSRSFPISSDIRPVAVVQMAVVINKPLVKGVVNTIDGLQYRDC